MAQREKLSKVRFCRMSFVLIAVTSGFTILYVNDSFIITFPTVFNNPRNTTTKLLLNPLTETELDFDMKRENVDKVSNKTEQLVVRTESGSTSFYKSPVGTSVTGPHINKTLSDFLLNRNQDKYQPLLQTGSKLQLQKGTEPQFQRVTDLQFQQAILSQLPKGTASLITTTIPNYCGVFYSQSMDLLAMEPIKPLPEFKNPCWYKGTEFQCFPYLFLTGFPKCGTTDIYNRLKQHPQYVQSTQKEYQWLSKTRFYKKISLPAYLHNYYHAASYRILSQYKTLNMAHKTAHSFLITGDSSATYIFDNDFWMLLPGNRNLTEPIYTNPYYIYHLYPQAKIIISVRNPIERLWSDFLYSSKSRTLMTADSFHKVVVKAVHMYQECFRTRSVRSCVYDRKLYITSTSDIRIQTSSTWVCPQLFQTNVHLRLGLYAVYIKEYLEVFPRDQVHIIKLEDYSKDIPTYLQRLFDFLGLDPLPGAKLRDISRLSNSNARTGTKTVIGTMKEETRRILHDFYKPFNEDLASLLNDQRFNYNIRQK